MDIKFFKKESPERKSGFYKVLVVVFIIFLILFVGLWIFEGFVARQAKKQVDEIQNWFEEMERLGYEMAMEDTYGGRTPHETLEMYIEAVEAGNYELASKYFIIPKQGEELNSLLNIKEVNPQGLEDYINILKKADSEKSLIDLVSENFVMEAPTDLNVPFRISFTLYPNGIWKIQSI